MKFKSKDPWTTAQEAWLLKSLAQGITQADLYRQLTGEQSGRPDEVDAWRGKYTTFRKRIRTVTGGNSRIKKRQQGRAVESEELLDPSPTDITGLDAQTTWLSDFITRNTKAKSGDRSSDGHELTIYQLPVTFYQLPSSFPCFSVSGKELSDFQVNNPGAQKYRGSGDEPFLIDPICISIKNGAVGTPSVPYLPSFLDQVWREKRLDSLIGCGYIHNMEDRRRNKDSMVHVRFTEEERRQLKAYCALQGMSMQEYIRAVVLKKLVRQKKRRDR